MFKPRHPCFCLVARLYLEINTGAPGVGGGCGEVIFIFRELDCTGK